MSYNMVSHIWDFMREPHTTVMHTQTSSFTHITMTLVLELLIQLSKYHISF